MNDDIQIRHELRCGDLGRIISLHGVAYEPLGGYGLRFEAFVGETIAEYLLHSGARGRIWLAERGKELVGCTAIVFRGPGVAQLRWVIVDPSARGQGLGSELMKRSLAYVKENNVDTVILETTDGLAESQAMYEKMGFEVTSETNENLWDGVRPLICMRLKLALYS